LRASNAAWIIGLSCLTTAIGALIPIVLLVFVFPQALAVLLAPMPSVVVETMLYSLLVIGPTTLVALPITAVALGRRATASLAALPVVGAAGGGLTAWLWLPADTLMSAKVLILGIAAIGGLAAGAIFGNAMYEKNK
jgi:hypothetical protein